MKNQKLQELVSNQIANALETVKGSKESSPKSSTKKSTEAPTAKVKKIKAAETQEKVNKVVKSAKVQQEAPLLEQVVSQREVKYIYPDDVQDTLARKKWRQKVRNELHRLEREMHRITDQNSNEFKAAKKAFEAYQKEVLKPNQVA